MIRELTTFYVILMQTLAIKSEYPLPNNILDIHGSQVHYISDFESIQQHGFIENVMEDKILPLLITNIKQVGADAETKSCKDLPPSHRDKMTKQSMLFFTWVNNEKLANVLKMHARSMTKCPKRIQVGHYYIGNSFIFLVDESLTEAKNRVFNDPLIRRHPNVAIVQEQIDKTIIYNYNLYSDEIILNMIMKENTVLKSKIFPTFNMQGYTLCVGTIPFGSSVIADKKTNPASPYQLFENYTGSDIDMLMSLAKRFNFTYKILNPLDMGYGILGEDGTWSGLVEMLWNDSIDIGISFYLTSERLQVTLPAIVYKEDYYTLASPNPTQINDYAILFHPLHLSTWLALVASFFAVACFLYFSARSMEKWYKYDLRDLSSISKVLLFTFGSAVDHSVMKKSDYRSQGKGTLRFVSVVWMAMTYIVIAGYTATLLSFFISPSFEKEIETFADALQSKIPLRGLLYGGLEVNYLKCSEDPVVKQIWKKMNKDPPDNNLAVMKEVYHRKLVYLTWYSALVTDLYVSYTTPDGQPLVHLSKYSPFPRQSQTWLYQTMSPWSENMNRQILTLLENGLVSAWEKKSVANMKRKTKIVNVASSESVATFGKREGQIALKIEDLYSIFIFLGLMFVFQFVLFTIEIFFVKCTSSKAGVGRKLPVGSIEL